MKKSSASDGSLANVLEKKQEHRHARSFPRNASLSPTMLLTYFLPRIAMLVGATLKNYATRNYRRLVSRMQRVSRDFSAPPCTRNRTETYSARVRCCYFGMGASVPRFFSIVAEERSHETRCI